MDFIAHVRKDGERQSGFGAYFIRIDGRTPGSQEPGED
jgi:hypothetical protein